MAIDSSPLFDILIGVDEIGTTEEINNKLKSISSSIKDLKLSIQVDKKGEIAIKRALDEVEASIKKLKPVQIVERSGMREARKEEEAAVQQLMSLYEGYAVTVTKVSRNTEGVISNIMADVKGTGDELRKVTATFGEAGNIVGKPTQRVVSLLDEGMKTAKASVKGLVTEYERLNATMSKSGVTTEGEARKVEILNQLGETYGSLTAKIIASNQLSEEEKTKRVQNIQSLQVESDQRIEASNALDAQQAKLKKAQTAYNDLKKAVADYNKQLQGKGGEKSDEQFKKETDNIRRRAQGFKEIQNEMSALMASFRSTKSSQQIIRYTDDLDRATKEVAKFSSALETTKLRLQESIYKGKANEIAFFTNQLEVNNASLNRSVVASDQAAQALAALGVGKGEIAAANREHVQTEEQLSNALKLNENSIEALTNKFGQLVTATKSGIGVKDLVQQLQTGAISADEFAVALYGYGAKVKDVTRDNTSFDRVFRSLNITVGAGTDKAQVMKLALDGLDNTIREIKAPVQGADKAIGSFSSRLTDAAKKIATWGLSTKIVYGTWRAFKEGVKTVQELDTQLTQIAVVQGLSRESTKDLGEQYADTAQKMAKTVQEVASLNTELVRQGLNLEEAAQRAQTIMKLSSTGMVSMEQSLQVITSGVNAMGETHERVADVILRASALSASDVEGLGEAFTKTASGAKAAGLSIEETTALLATMKDITQEGDSQLGTSLKSMLARFNKINEETGELNTDLNEVQTAIESVGVQFTDSEGQIRSFYDILQDLSVGWDGLDKNTKAYIATQAAGVRQQNRFYAIMDNFNRVQGINNDLTQSAGTLQSAYATYMDSSEAASKRLKAALENMWVGFIDSDVVIGITNIATGIVNLTDKLGILVLGMTAFTLKTLLSSTAIKTLFAATKGGALASFAAQAAGTATALQGASLAALQTTFSFSALKAAAIATAGTLKATLLAIGAVLPQLILFTAAGAAVGYLVSKLIDWIGANKRAKIAQEELMQSAFEMYSSQQTQTATIEELKEEYDGLVAKMREVGGVYGLSAAEQERYYATQLELKNLIPDLESHEDQYGNTILDNVGSVESLTKAYQDLVQERMKEASVGFEQRIEDKIKARKETEAEKEAEKQINILMSERRKLDNQLKVSPKAHQDNLEKIAEIDSKIKELSKMDLEVSLDKGSIALSELKGALIAEFGSIPEDLNLLLQQDPVKLALSDMDSEDMYPFVLSIKQALEDPANQIKMGDSMLSLEGIDEKILELNTKLMEGGLDQAAYQEQINLIIEGLKTLAQGADEEIALVAQSMLEGISSLTTSVKEKVVLTAEELAAVNKQYAEDFKESYNEAQSTLTELAESYNKVTDAKITDAEIDQMILSTYPQHMQFLGDRIGLEGALGDAYIDTANTQAEAYIQMIENTGEFTGQAYGLHATMFNDLGLAYVTDLQNSKNRAEAKGKVEAALIRQLGNMWSKYFAATGDGIKFSAQAYEASAEAQNLSFEDRRRTSNALYQMQVRSNQKAAEFGKIIDTTTFDVAKITMNTSNIKDHAANIAKSSKKAAGSAKKGADSTKKMADEAKRAADAIKEMNEHMKGIQDETKEVFDFALEYIENIKKKRIEAQDEVLEKAKKAAEEEYKTVTDKIKERETAELDILKIKEDSLKIEKETNDYLAKRNEIQGDIAELEYKAALASLDGSAAGASKRRTLAEQIANRQKELDGVVEDRREKLQTEAFARQRQFVQDQAEWERAQAERTKNAKVEKAEDVHKKEIAFLDAKYSAENNYLAARQAVQTGMIKDLHGNMIPLVEAFKELAIENGKFWTFFGQQEVSDFGTRVGNVMQYVKDLGFETIQTWKAVKEAVDAATSAASNASSSGGGGGSSGISSGTAPAKSKPVAAPSTPAPKTQTQINREFQSWMQDQMGRVGLTKPKGFAVDGAYGPATRAAATLLQNKNVNTHSITENLLAKAAQSTSIPESSLLSLKKHGIKIPAANTGGSSASKNTYMAYAQGGKIDYTGPASVHGSKSKPEYVFNYPQFKDLAKMIATHQFKAPKVAVATGRVPTLTIDNFIRVDGNIDKDSLPEFKRASQDAITQLANKLRGMGK